MVYRFGEYTLDNERYELRWRGDELDLEPKVFEVLSYLARNRGRVVAKSELLEQLWPDQVVGEWSLTRCISVARKAVQDSPNQQRVIQTLYGRGYRFVAPVEEQHRGAGLLAAGARSEQDLIGRERALQELDAGLEDAFAGRGRVLLVTGETGIGKSCLVDAFAAGAERRGAQVRIGRCWETEGAPAFWPWIQILRADLRARGAEAMLELLGNRSAEVQQLLPELFDELDERPRVQGLEPRQARFRLFDAVSLLWKRAAQDAPVVLVLDDLHRADPPSLRMLEFIARELSRSAVLLVATCREDELAQSPGRRRIVGSLARAAAARYVALEGLDVGGVASLIEQATGEAPSEGVALALQHHTAGNPFFLSQVIPALAADGRLGSEGTAALDLAPPQGVRQAVLSQLDGLSEPARAALEAASVLGRSFARPVLEAMLATPPSDLGSALAELTRTGFAREEGEGSDRFRFAHALVREALYSELGPDQRAELHRVAGEALERVHGEGHPDHLSELAHHFSEARSAGAGKRALDYAVAAARSSSGQLAYEEASRHYERALELCELPEVSDEALRCDLLVELGSAQLRAGDGATARNTLERASELARGLHAPERLAQAAIALAQTFQPFARGVVDLRLVSLLESSLARLPERDGALRARAMMALGVALYWADDRSLDCTRLCEEAYAMARRVGDTETLLATMSAVISVRWGPDLVEERAELASEAIRVGETAGVKEELIDARLMRLVAWFELGRMDDVDRELALISRLASRLQRSEVDEYLPWFRATRAIMSGHFDLAEPLAGEFLEQVQKRDDERGLLVFTLQFLGLRWTQGRSDETRELLEDLCERHPAVPMYRAALLRAHCELGQEAEARRLLEQLMPGDMPLLTKRLGWFPSLAMLAESAALLGDRGRCAALYRELSPYARRHVTSGAAAYMGSTSRYLGQLASELERWDMARRHFEVALEMEGQIGALPLVAWTQYHYAQMLWREGRDPARARELGRVALDRALELDLPALARRIRQLAP